jgi:hypothetical protein
LIDFVAKQKKDINGGKHRVTDQKSYCNFALAKIIESVLPVMVSASKYK